MTLERIFMIAAVLFAASAGYFYWAGSNDAAFISGVLACVAFFLNVRYQSKTRVRELDADRIARSDDEIDEDAARDRDTPHA